MFGLSFFWWAEREHLDLVEPVDPEDSAGVLAVAARLPPVAGRPAGIPLRSVGEVDDLVGVAPLELDLTGGAPPVARIIVLLLDLLAEELRLAHQALGEITGEFTSDDLLGEIFGRFCIGK